MLDKLSVWIVGLFSHDELQQMKVKKKVKAKVEMEVKVKVHIVLLALMHLFCI